MSFVSYERTGWNFGVKEKLHGVAQLVDITEHFSGEPHADAKEHVPMYVNEVGYSKELVKNVAPREQDGRVVGYYFHTKEPLTPGQEGTFVLHRVNITDTCTASFCHIILNLMKCILLTLYHSLFSFVATRTA